MIVADIYYNVYHPNEGYVIPLYNIYSYNYSTDTYELLVDRSRSGNLLQSI